MYVAANSSSQIGLQAQDARNEEYIIFYLLHHHNVTVK